jgi:hypothetical protein
VGALSLISPTSAYVSIRQHTSAYVSIRQHTYDIAASDFRFVPPLPSAARFPSTVVNAMRRVLFFWNVNTYISPDHEVIGSVCLEAEHLDIDAPGQRGRSVADDARALDDESDCRPVYPTCTVSSTDIRSWQDSNTCSV